MTGSQYRNVIKRSLKKVDRENSRNYANAARQIFNNCGVAFPHGGYREVLQKLMTDDYMVWRSCTYKQAQECANAGIATVGVNSDHVVVIEPENDAVYVEDTADRYTDNDGFADTVDSIDIEDRMDMQFFAYTLSPVSIMPMAATTTTTSTTSIGGASSGTSGGSSGTTTSSSGSGTTSSNSSIFKPINVFNCYTNGTYNPNSSASPSDNIMTYDHQNYLNLLTKYYENKDYYKKQGYDIDAYLLMGICFGESNASKSSKNPFGEASNLSASASQKAIDAAINALINSGLATSKQNALSKIDNDNFYLSAARVLSYLDNGKEYGVDITVNYESLKQAMPNIERWREAVKNGSTNPSDYAYYYY